MKERAKNLLCDFMDLSGVLDRRINSIDDAIWLIPMYHRIILDEKSEDPLDMGMCVSEGNFRKQLDYLKHNFDIVSVAEVVQMIHSRQALPKRLASVTFDDGYLDNLTIAAPILDSYGIRATLFVATDYIGSDKGFWWDEIISAFAYSPEGSKLDLELSHSQRLTLRVEQQQRRAQAQKVLDSLWQQPPESVRTLVDTAREQLNTRKSIPSPVMNEAQILQAVDIAFDLGAHTQSHPNLNLLSREGVENELRNSRNTLCRLINDEILGFAMPAGFTPDFLIASLRQNGFDYAMSTERGLNRKPNLYELQRIGMPNSPPSRIKRAIGGL